MLKNFLNENKSIGIIVNIWTFYKFRFVKRDTPHTWHTQSGWQQNEEQKIKLVAYHLRGLCLDDGDDNDDDNVIWHVPIALVSYSSKIR